MTLPSVVSKKIPGSFEFTFNASSPGSITEDEGRLPRTLERLKINLTAILLKSADHRMRMRWLLLPSH